MLKDIQVANLLKILGYDIDVQLRAYAINKVTHDILMEKAELDLNAKLPSQNVPAFHDLIS